MPTFTFEKVAATTYRVLDAHTREWYGYIERDQSGYWWQRVTGATFSNGPFDTREDAARAVYLARHAHGFQAGAL